MQSMLRSPLSFALAVVYPSAGNIGGGGFMVLRLKDGASFTLDYREAASDSASADMYLDSTGNVIAGLSERGHLSAGVPVPLPDLLKHIANLENFLAAIGSACHNPRPSRLSSYGQRSAKPQ